MYKDINGKTGIKGLVGTSGTTYGNTKLFTADEKAAMLLDGITEVVPEVPPAPDPAKVLEKAKENRLRYIAEAAAYVMEQPITIQVQGQDKVFPMDEGSKQWRHAANSRAANGKAFGPGDYHKTVDRERVQLSNQIVKDLANASFDLIDDTQKIADDLVDAVLVAADVAAVEAVEWPWPGGTDPRPLV